MHPAIPWFAAGMVAVVALSGYGIATNGANAGNVLGLIMGAGALLAVLLDPRNNKGE